MKERHIRQVDLLSDSTFFLVSTDGTQNYIELLDENLNRRILVRWHGAEVTGGASNGDIFVCTTVENVLYVIEGSEVRAFPTDEQYVSSLCFETVRTLTGIGSKGRIFEIDVYQNKLITSRLGEYGIQRPGRDFIGISPTKGGCLLFGKKQLLLEKINSSISDVAGAPTGEDFYFSACKEDNEYWAAGLRSNRPVLTRYVNGEGYHYPAPTEHGRAPVLAIRNRQLLIGSQIIFQGLPESWREVFDFGEPTLISLIPHPTDEGCYVCVGFDGKIESFLLD